jgi:hypothetical protein
MPMPTMPTWFSPTTAELACYVTLRGPHFYAKTFFTSLVAATLFVDLLPLFMTGTPSYGAASKVCFERFSPLRIAWYADPESSYYEPEWDVDADDNAAMNLFPSHQFNSISTAISLFGFWVWLFFSPHKSEQAKHLDRTCTTSACALFRDFNLLTLALCNPCFRFVVILSGELLCSAVAGKPPCYSDIIGGQLRGIGIGVYYFNSHQRAREPWPVWNRNESLVPPLFV